MSEQTPGPELTAIEAALKALTPLPDRLARDRLMFDAGRASAPRRGLFWPGATVASSLLAALFGGALLFRMPAEPVVHLVTVYESMPAPGMPASPERLPLAASSLLRVQRAALRDGDALSFAGLTDQPASRPAVDVETSPSLIGRKNLSKS